MANRHLSRSIAMQVLFEWDFNDYSNVRVDDVINRTLREFAPGLEDREFVEKLVRGVLENKKKIDAFIEKTAPEWPIAQIAPVDRSVLRIGLFELVFGNHKEVPPKVAINEAIELSKSFGGETSGKFVNGVLGTVYREMGEPGKDDLPAGKAGKNVEIPIEKLAGAVVYRLPAGQAGQKEKEEILYALVHDVFGFWTLSKGKLEKGEDFKKGVVGEIKEELGIDIEVEDELGSNEYIAFHPEKGQIKKQVTYFLAKTKDENLILEQSGGLDDAKWFKQEELEDLKIYDDLKPLIVKAIKILKS